jgi:peroxiredoxin
MTTNSQTPTSETPIADQVAFLVSQVGEHLPADVVATFQAEQAELGAAGVPSGVAPTGTKLPDVELLDGHGNATTLDAQLAGRVAVIVFYRGAWCPYCNIALRAYQAELADPLAERGAVLVAISPQKPDGSLSMTETNELTFTVLSDPGNQLAGALGILTEPNEDSKQAQARLGLDLREVNADGTATLPMPTTIVVDAGRTVRWIDVHPDYTTRGEPTAILAAIDDQVL